MRLTMHLTQLELIGRSRDVHIRALGKPKDCAVTSPVMPLFDPSRSIAIDDYAAQ